MAESVGFGGTPLMLADSVDYSHQVSLDVWYDHLNPYGLARAKWAIRILGASYNQPMPTKPPYHHVFIA
jgi:hypothetical protein